MFGLKNLFKGGGSDKDSSTKKTTPTNTQAPKKVGGIGAKSIGAAPKPMSPRIERTEPPSLANHKSTLPKLSPNSLELTPKKEPSLELELDLGLSKPSSNNDEKVKPQVTSTPVVSTKMDLILQGTTAIEATSAIEEEVATIFSEGDNDTSIALIKDYFKQNSGKVEPRVWFMLLDLYQVIGAKDDFDKTALAFAHEFGTSPPSWFGELHTEVKKDSMGGGKNMIILEPIMKEDYIDKFKELFKVSKKENFCRINVSQCKFEQNSPEILEKFLKLLLDLRKAKVVSVLMGDNNLIAFCKKFIQDANYKKPPTFENHEQLIWLIYLELLQWKGQLEEFENIALEFAEKFEISPPGWDDKGVMDLSSVTKDNTEDDNSIGLDKDINGNNIDPLLNYIKSSFEKGSHAEVDMAKIDRIDFSAAGSISFHIQELWSNPSFSNKKVIFKHPNELVIILLHMVGVTEFVHIIPRNRK